ncbi:MAG: sugar phosphate isomerase/epimerase family protein [Armatimonadota bacterium]
MSIGSFCDLARSCGADGIEILDAFLYAPGVSRDHLPEIESFRDKLRESLGELHLHAVAVTNDFSHEGAARLELEKEKVELGVALAVEFGSGIVRVFSAHPDEETKELSRLRAINGLSGVDPQGRVLALENHGVHFGTPSEVLTISRGAGTGICFDIGNWLLAGVDPVRAACELPFPDLVHVKDFATDPSGSYQTPEGEKLQGAFLGEGVVPIQETLRALFSRPDRRPVPIDLELECGDQGVEATREGVSWLRSLLAQLDPTS